LPPASVVGQSHEEAAQQWRQTYELARRAGLMIIRVFDLVENLQPFEETLLHVRRAEGQPVADVVEQKKVALGKESAGKKRFERDVLDLLPLRHGKDVEDVPVQHKQGVSGAVPAAGQFQGPATQRKSRLVARGR